MQAFGSPGSAPSWTSSAKDLVGGSLGPARLWFTTGYGIVNEVYSPRIDIPQIRDLGFIVADDGPFGLALAAVDRHQCDTWGVTSAGFVGASDGWQDFNHNGRITWQFDSAGPGNVALVGALPCSATLALGFGASRESAATLAVSSLCQSFDNAWDAQVDSWQNWHSGAKRPTDLPERLQEQLMTSAMVLRVHQDKTFCGAMVASLSVPWGNVSDNVGGYHLVWPRDLVESAGGLLALGALPEARNILRYLIATQLADGNWSQNQWLGGKPFWHGSQLDEAAFPVLLAASLAERDALDDIEVKTMVRQALSFIARTGPATGGTLLRPSYLNNLFMTVSNT